jgi:serine/threonine protein kinase
MGDEANQRIGDYEILNVLGSGGMGRVYRVRNVISDRIEAMKVLLPNLVGHQELAARFQREIKVLATLHHPNIAALRTALTGDNQLVMIMEYIEGSSLAERLNRGPIETTDALNYIDQVLDALSYAHSQHVVHRDIKPGNMMLTSQGVVKLMDFGIARTGDDQPLTKTGMTPGSLRYMSPEQIKGQEADARSDLYSVGISLYEMVTGHRPFQADSDYGLMSAHLGEVPTPPISLLPGLLPELNDVILTAIEKDPDRRFQSADSFRDALRRVRQDAVPTRPATAPGGTIIESAASSTLVQEAAMAATNQTPATVRNAPLRSVEAPPRPGVPLNPAPPPRVRGAKHPVLYMALGGLLVIGGLVGLAIYSRRAEADTPNQKADPVRPAEVEPSIPPPIPPPIPEPLATIQPTPNAGLNASKPTAPKRAAAAGALPRRAAGESATNLQDAAQDPVDLNQMEREIDQVFARASTVDRSLNRLQAQQARQGLGLRGDMAARQESLRLNVSRAQEAVNQKNAAQAKRYKDLAESDLEVLERFLGL